MKNENIQDIYELSPIQQGMLFHALLAPESGVYFEQFSFLLQGDLNVEAFQQAWQGATDRHSVLRTSFHWEGLKKPLQVVFKHLSLTIEQEDWRMVPEAELDARWEQFLQDDRQRGFTLNRAPLQRVILIRTGEETYRLVWSFHHLLIDGWSFSQLIKEVLFEYEAITQGQPLAFEPSSPFGDYVGWLQAQDEEDTEAYWKGVLKGIQSPTSLVVDNTSVTPLKHEMKQDEVSIHFSVEESAAMQSFARQHRYTLNVLVQGAWALLLNRYSAEETVLFGVTLSGRSAGIEGIETMVGCFINTLPISLQVRGEEKILSYLESVQAKQIDLQKYESTPLVQVQEWSSVGQGVQLFDSILVFENYPIDEMLVEEKRSLDIRNLSAFEQTNFPLTVAVLPGKQLTIGLTYDCARFDRATIERMAGHLTQLLTGMISDPNRALADLTLLTEAEQQMMLYDWNKQKHEVPEATVCVHQLFEQQVERTPDVVAVKFKDRSLTFRELNQRANQLAHRLRANGVGPESLVGMCLDRSEEMIVAALGIQKAGGAYVPIDPNYPTDRIARMFDVCDLKVLVTEEPCVANLPEVKCPVLCLDTARAELAQEADTNLETGVQPHNLAYIIFTSGTTGLPKGVMLQHDTLVQVAHCYTHENGIVPGHKRVLQFASMSFDVFAGDLLKMINGATLVVCPAETRLDIPALYQLLYEERITLLDTTPGLSVPLMDYIYRNELPLPDLKQMLVSADIFPWNDYRTMLERFGHQIRILNCYGITETTIDSSNFEVFADYDFPTSGAVPIGKPYAYARFYILDDRFRPVPIGVPGELYVGGTGVSRGYYNNPELTAEKFLADPFMPGQRMYKTGDLAKWTADGDVAFLGRQDFQVKIRGFRIELGDIEAVLEEHPSVADAVVDAAEDSNGVKRLVAYVVTNEGHEPLTREQWRNLLQEKLPEHMVPHVYVMLDALPLTPNGKVDRRGLPKPDMTADLEETYVAPSTPLQEKLASIWADVLRVERVGATDNFFELGGQSLLAMQVFSRMREVTDVPIKLSDLFERPTVQQLATHVEELSAQGLTVAPISNELLLGEIPLAPIQRFVFRDPFEEAAKLVSEDFLEISGPVHAETMNAALQELLQHHDMLRATFVQEEGTIKQVLQAPAGLSVAFEFHDLSNFEEKQTKAEIKRIDKQLGRPFALDQAPLFRAALVRQGNGVHTLRLFMSHLIVDGFSWQVVTSDLKAIYEQLERGETPVAPLKTASYASWVTANDDVINSAEGCKIFSAWQPYLEKLQAAPAIHLPVDNTEGENRVCDWQAATTFLDEATTSRLLHETGKSLHVTIKETILTAAMRAIATWSEQESVLIDVEGHGRHVLGENIAMDLSRTVGWFADKYPLLVNIPQQESVATTVRKVDAELKQLPHQGASFSMLRELSRDEDVQETFAKLPSAKIAFNYLGQLDGAENQQESQWRELSAAFDGMESEQEAGYQLLLICYILNGQLELHVAYSEQRYTEDTIGRLTNGFAEQVQELIQDGNLVSK